MTVDAPLIVKKSYDELVSHLEILLQEYSNWQPPAAQHDAATALTRIFSRFAELVSDRINQVPDKHFLAFLDMVGLELRPPQPARVPLSFILAEGGVADTVVPKYTRVAAILGENESEPVIFETERELVASRSKLVSVYAREPEQDRVRNLVNTVSGANVTVLPLFEGDAAIAHQFYINHKAYYNVEGIMDITVQLKVNGASALWLQRLDWQYRDGDDWIQLRNISITEGLNNVWDIVLHDVPTISIVMVDEIKQAWLKAVLKTPLPRIHSVVVDPEMIEQDELIAEGSFSATVPLHSGQTVYPYSEPANAYVEARSLDLAQTFHPFGEAEFTPAFYIPCDIAFSKPDAQITVRVNLDALRLPQATTSLRLFWFIWGLGLNTATGEYIEGWNTLGESTPTSPSENDKGYGFTDNTRAFTQDGTITFNCPANWRAHTVNGQDGYWLCASVQQGDYGSGSGFRPPVVDAFILNYNWPLPLIDTLQTRSHMEDTGLLPDLAYTNQQPVDLSKTFLPFGEKPGLGDTFYFRCDEGFIDKPDAIITITFNMDTINVAVPSTNPALKLVWDFWSGASGRWEEVGTSRDPMDAASAPYYFNDTTNRFSTNGGVTFHRPLTMAQSEVNGEIGYWLRVRILQGHYGSEAHYEPVVDGDGAPVYFPDTQIQQYQLVPADFRPPYVVQMQLAYDYTSAFENVDFLISENDHRLVDHTASSHAGNVTFHPFTLTEDQAPTLYLGFARAGDVKGFATSSNSLYFSIADVPYDKSLDDAPRVTEKASLEWEYWNGAGWNELGVDDETTGLSKRGLISFIGPEDFVTSSEFSSKAFWLRARWVRGEYSTMPGIQRILTNTTWANHTLTIENKILGSSNGEPDQLFRIPNIPVLYGEQLEIKEADQPSAQEREQIIREEGEDAIHLVMDASDRARQVWVRWHKVPDFYGSGPRSRHYIIDRISGEVRFGDGNSGLIPPQGRGNVRIRKYQSGGGRNGNRTAGSIIQLKSTVPAVESVINWEGASGGGPREELATVKVRGPKTLRHRDRAVAISDYEDLAFEASTNVARARGIAADNAINSGRAGLIIVPNTRETRPVPSTGLLGLVKEYIQQRLSPTVELWVAGPDWLKVSVTVEVVPVSISEATNVKTALLSSLASFLHPLTGGLDEKGWAFGRKPYRSDLYSRIENTEGVDYVRRLDIVETGEVTAGSFLVYSGTHNIEVVGETSA